MSRRVLLLGAVLVGLVAFAAGASAQPADEAQAMFAKANQAYLDSSYADAANAYAELLEVHRVDDPRLYANLGNAYFRMGQYGSAIFAYRRALRLDPEAEVARRVGENLDTTRRVLEERYRSGNDKSQFIFNEPGGLLYRVTHALGRAPLVVAFLAAWFLVFGLLIGRRLLADKKLLGTLVLPASVVAVLLGLMLWGQSYTDSSLRIGVVIEAEVTMREGRHGDARGVGIPEGLEVRIVEADEEWTLVELANGREGWVETKTVKQI